MQIWLTVVWWCALLLVDVDGEAAGGKQQRKQKQKPKQQAGVEDR